MRSYRPQLVVLCLLVASLHGAILLGCHGNSGEESSSSGGAPAVKVRFRLQWLDQAQFAGFYVAKANGFYAEKGLDVSIEAGGADFNSPKLVAAGSDDIGLWTADQVLLARGQKLPIKAVGVVFQESLAGFMVAENSPIRSPADFAGRTVGMYYGYDTETLYLALIRKFGVDRKSVRETAVQYDLARFMSGEVDVWPSYVINQPISARRLGKPVRVLRPSEFGIRYYSDTLIVSDSYLAQHRDVVERFLEASERGWRFALEHPDQAVQATVARDSHLDPADQTEMMAALRPYVRSESSMFKMDPAVWASIGDALSAQGLLTDASNVISQLCDYTLAK